MDFSPEKMRARFRELTEQTVKLHARRDPVRAKRDALVKKQMAALAKADAEVTKAEEGLFEIDQERAMLVRALGGKTGEPDEEA